MVVSPYMWRTVTGKAPSPEPASVGSLLDLALEKGIIEKRGSWLSYNGNQLAQGRDAAKDTLRTDATLYAEIEEKVKAALAEENS